MVGGSWVGKSVTQFQGGEVDGDVENALPPP